MNFKNNNDASNRHFDTDDGKKSEIDEIQSNERKNYDNSNAN